MLDVVYNTIIEKNLIKPGDNVLACVSGGADSVCMLHILNRFSYKININEIYAVHINHMLRGKESDMDEKYVKQLCKSMGIKLFCISLNIRELAKNQNVSIEEAARNARYKEFRRLASSIGNCKIAVAHNKNDQAETVMMNLIRGTGLDGLRGMDYIRDNIIRPLLDVDRIKIEEYCAQSKLEPRTDSTNLQNIYTRNKVRLDVIPFINENFNVNAVENIVRMADLVRDDFNYLNETALEVYNRCLIEQGEIIYLNIKKLKELHTAVLKRVLRIALQKLKGNIKNIESIHINKIRELCLDGRTGAVIHLPSNVRVAKSYDILKIYLNTAATTNNNTNSTTTTTNNNNNNISGCINGEGQANSNEKHNIILKLSDRVNIYVPSYMENKTIALNSNLIKSIKSIESINLKATIINREKFDVAQFKSMRYNSLIQFFDYDKIIEGSDIVLRNREIGDLIKPLKSSGTKKLKEYMIDNKMPREIRDKILLLAKGNEIIWIIGFRISDKFKVTENTKSIIKFEVDV